MTPYDLIICESDAAASAISAFVSDAGADDPSVFSLETPAWRGALALIEQAEHPLFVVGDGSRLGRLAAALTTAHLAERVEIAFVAGYETFGDRLDGLLETMSTKQAVTLKTLGGGDRSIPVIRFVQDSFDPLAVLEVALHLGDRSRRTRPGRRVGFLGQTGEKLLGGGVVVVQLSGAEDLRDAVSSLDFVVLDGDTEGLDRIGEVIEGASARTILVDAEQTVSKAVRVDLFSTSSALEPMPAMSLSPAVDERFVNPAGYSRSSKAGFVALVEDEARADRALLEAATQRTGGRPVSVMVAGGRSVIVHLREATGVVLVGSGFATPGSLATKMIELAAAGVPVMVAELNPAARAMVGEELAQLFSSVSAGDLVDENARELHSVKQRRLALRDHTFTQRWRAIDAHLGIPSIGRDQVTALIATNRPDHIDHALSQVARQNYPDLECVFVLHGDGFPADMEDRIAGGLDIETRVLRAPSEMVLGDVLNAGVWMASGDFVAKMDDDDFYGVDHIWDLVLAHSYSGAPLVGKAAEFVYLAPEDLTIRRFAGGAEAPTTTIAGGAFMVEKTVWKAVDGFRRLSVGEDRALVRDVLGVGGSVWRTHGFGFVLNRHGEGHSWLADSSYFIDQATSRRTGSDFEWCGI
ncbi:MAG: glycosyltransferase family A protein [Acidimicrobiia bacterium]|nr:glycosyltransferase family A protein [Acidimicrobiia bacterium]